MRPGSPVRSPAQQVRMAHSLWNNAGNLAAAAVPTASTPAAVWVALATYTKAVVVNTQAATAPISGGPQGIFNRPQAVTEQVNTAEVLAVCARREEAEAAVALHRSLNAQLQADYSVTEHTVGPKDAPAPHTNPETYPCIGGCGKTLSGGISWCEPCRQKHWASSGWRGDD